MTLLRADIDDVVRFWRRAGVRAYAVAGEAGQVVVFDEADPSGSEEAATALVVGASAAFVTVVIAATVIDSDVMMFSVASSGVVVDQYSSCPAYFDDAASFDPTGGDAQLLADLFGRSDHTIDPQAVRAILDDIEYVFADDPQRDVFRALGLPMFAASNSFERLDWTKDLAAELRVQASAVHTSFDR